MPGVLLTLLLMVTDRSHPEVTQADSAAQLRLLPPRLSPGAGLMERIQAIAQNVSDIAMKVDQILRHSLLLHSKGGCRRAATLPKAQALGRVP